MSVEKLYESDNFIVVNKPYDMYINSDDKNEKNTVGYHIASHDSHFSSSTQPLHFVHRLDYATSGVLCMAKNKTTAAKVGKLLEQRLARKYYLAVLRGHVKDDMCHNITYDVAEDMTTDTTNHKMVAVIDADSERISRHRRKAQTTLLVLEKGYYEEQPASVVLLKPYTGRRHQLRVHCAAIGHTILGDYTYSDRKDSEPHRMFLHAIRLVLPLTQEPLDIMINELFFSDPRFKDKWKTETMIYNYHKRDDLMIIYEFVDNISANNPCKKYEKI